MRVEIINRSDASDENKVITKNKKKTAFSKKLTILFVLTCTCVTFATLYLCYICITMNYTGSLTFLSALIGLQEVALGYVCGEYMKKSKAENTVGGVVYDTAINSTSTDPNVCQDII